MSITLPRKEDVIVTRRAMIPLTGDGSGTPRQPNAGSGGISEMVQRGLVYLYGRPGRKTLRWRLRGVNKTYADSVYSSGTPVTLPNFYVGTPQFDVAESRPWDGDFAAAPDKWLSSWATNADGSEAFSPWVEDDEKQYDFWLPYGFSMGIQVPTSTQIAAASVGGLTYAPGGSVPGISADGSVGAVGNPSSTSPSSNTGEGLLDIRLEYEYEDSVFAPLSRFMVIGDSIARGTSDSPDFCRYQHGSWPGIAAARNLFIPMNGAIGGTSITQWNVAATSWIYQRMWPTEGAEDVDDDGNRLFDFDGCVIALGTNTINTGGSAATIEAAIANMVSVIGAHYNPRRFYFANVIPRAFSAPKETERNTLNDWYRGRPLQIAACLDMDRALRDPDDPTIAEATFMSGTANTHPGPRGYTRMAEAAYLH